MLKKVLVLFAVIVVIIALITVSMSGCDKKDSENTNDGNVSVDDTVVMTINGYNISGSVYKIMLYYEAVQFRHEQSEQSDLKEDEYNEWLLNFFTSEIDGVKVFDIIREKLINSLKEYVFLMQSANEKGIKLDEADIPDIEAEEIIMLEDEYDPENPDEYFSATYEVTKRQYLDYRISRRLIEKYISYEEANQDITEDKLAEYKEIYGGDFEIKVIRNIYLSVSNESEKASKTNLANTILTRIRNGEDMKNLVNEYSEDEGSEDGLFTLSREENDYPYEILGWIEISKPGDSGIVEVSDDIYILKYEELKFEDNMDEQLKIMAGADIYREKLPSLYSSDKYTPVLNESVYNSYTKLPGDLMPDENAVG